jgi:hypothetical protein
MRVMKYLSLFVLAGCLFLVSPPRSQAQVSLGIQIGPAPVCPYGYYAYPPYNCAPYGYYGPSWFTNGIFIGAGPWFRGPARFHGWVNPRFDPRHGYHGALPPRGGRPNWHQHPHFNREFHRGEMHDGHGNVYHGGRGHH